MQTMSVLVFVEYDNYMINFFDYRIAYIFQKSFLRPHSSSIAFNKTVVNTVNASTKKQHILPRRNEHLCIMQPQSHARYETKEHCSSCQLRPL